VPQPEPRSTTGPGGAPAKAASIARRARAELGIGEMPIWSVLATIDTAAMNARATMAMSAMGMEAAGSSRGGDPQSDTGAWPSGDAPAGRRRA